MSMGIGRNALMTTSAMMCMAAASPVAAQSKSFDVPAQPVQSAVMVLGRQADIQIVAARRDTRGKRANAVRGAMTVDEALTRMLSGTGLTARRTGPQTYTVIANQSTAVEQPPLTAKPASSLSDGESKAAIPEILVTGSRSQNVDIARTEDDIQPYVVLGRDEIDRAQASNVEDLLRRQLPMNTQRVASNQGNAATNVNSIDLRGLGPNQTLILVDGRRVAGFYDGLEVSQPDINSIPLSSIERIEVLPSTASGIYGGGATGGVINIVRRRDYNGIDLRAELGGTARGDALSAKIEGSAGLSLEDGRTRILTSGSYQTSSDLLVSDRSFATQARRLQLRNNPAAFSQLPFPPNGSTPNILNSSGQDLVLDNGQSIGSPYTYVPAGSNGSVTSILPGLIANAGEYNLGLSDDLFGRRSNILATPRTGSAAFNIRRDFGSKVEAFLDLNWSSNRSNTVDSGLANFVTIDANAPNNPFTTDIYASFPANGLNLKRFTSSKLLQVTGGIIYKLSPKWTLSSDISLTRSSSLQVLTSPVLTSAGESAIRSGTLNILADPSTTEIDFSPFLMTSGNSTSGPRALELLDANLRASGSLFNLPGGALTLSALLERQQIRASKAFQDLVNADGSADAFFFPSRSQTINSAYIEINAPLVSEANNIPLLSALSLQFSARYDHYRTRGPTSLYFVDDRDAALPEVEVFKNESEGIRFTAGLSYSAADWIILRGSYGTGFLPPSLSQIAPNAPFTLAFPLVDPRRGSITTFNPVMFTFGGNPDLSAEQSASWSLGLIVRPPALPGLRLSADFTSIRKKKEISSLSYQQIVDLESQLPGRIVRGPNLPGDPQDWAGPITSVDVTSVNIANTTVKAFDFQADYTTAIRSFGNLHVYGTATLQSSLARRLTPESSLVEYVGSSSGPLKWRGNAGVDWKSGAVSLGWNVQYYGSYRVFAADADAPTVEQAVLNQGSNTIPSQVYNDFYAAYTFKRVGFLRGAELRLGVQNVFDTSPPIIASTTGIFGGYSTYGDARLRRFTMALRGSF